MAHSDPEIKIPFTLPLSSTKERDGVRGELEIEAWDLFGIWILEFGI